MDIDKTDKYIGFVYVLIFQEPNRDWYLKIGSTKNPVMRLGEHYYRNYPYVSVHKISWCYDYLKCEAEIKKLSAGHEEIYLGSKLGKEALLFERKVCQIITKYECVELDVSTVDLLLEVENIKKYFKEKDGSRIYRKRAYYTLKSDS